MNAYITLKLMNGEYRNILASSIEQVFVSTTGEKMVFFNDKYGTNCGIEVEVKGVK